MLPLFQNSSTASRDLQDNCWLLWQLVWLYQDTPVFKEPLLQALKGTMASLGKRTQGVDLTRTAWMLDIGLPIAPSSEPLEKNIHPARRLRNILQQNFSADPSPENVVKNYLRTTAGLPDSAWSSAQSWIDDQLKGTEPVVSNFRPLELIENHSWLSPKAVVQVLEEDPSGSKLLALKNLNFIPLPASLPRPASLMLADGSLWLAWPEHSASTVVHPLVQASLVCHEAAHLLKNHHTRTKALQDNHDTIWMSESEAVHAEWNALTRYCNRQPEKLRQRFLEQWYEENFHLQKRIFLEDWKEFDSKENTDKTEHEMNRAEKNISLPFLSLIYACIAAQIYSPST